MLKQSFVYSDPTRGVVTISIDDIGERGESLRLK